MKRSYFKIGLVCCLIAYVLSWFVVEDTVTNRLAFLAANLFPAAGLAADAWQEKSRFEGIISLVYFGLIFVGMFRFWLDRR